MTFSNRTTAIALVLVVGPGCRSIDWPVVPRPPQPTSRAVPEQTESAGDVFGSRLVSIEDVLDAEVVDHERAEVGALYDLIVDGRSGRALSALVSASGETESNVVPFADFDLNDREGRVKLRFARDELPEVPEPGPYEGLSRLFREQKLASVEGEITGIRPTQEAASELFFVQLREANNHYHRVYIGPADFVTDVEPTPKRGQQVRIEGVLTRDTKGRLWVASAVHIGGATLRLRKPTGEPVWDNVDDEPASTEVSLRALASGKVLLADDVTAMVSGLFFDREEGRVCFLALRVDGGDHVLPWRALVRDENGYWQTRLTADDVVLRPLLTDWNVSEIDESFWADAAQG